MVFNLQTTPSQHLACYKCCTQRIASVSTWNVQQLNNEYILLSQPWKQKRKEFVPNLSKHILYLNEEDIITHDREHFSTLASRWHCNQQIKLVKASEQSCEQQLSIQKFILRFSRNCICLDSDVKHKARGQNWPGKDNPAH